MVERVFTTVAMMAIALRLCHRGMAADAPAAARPAEPVGILPLPDYSGDVLSRHYVTGDWGGARVALAKRGIQFDVDWTQTWASSTRWIGMPTNLATRLRREFGIDVAQSVLGHQIGSAITEVYAEADAARIAEVMAQGR